MVSKITDANGNTVQNIEPTLIKETISEETSATIRQYLQGVIVNGSGKKAKVDGYSMGGKPVLRRNYRVQPENTWYLL